MQDRGGGGGGWTSAGDVVNLLERHEEWLVQRALGQGKTGVEGLHQLLECGLPLGVPLQMCRAAEGERVQRDGSRTNSRMWSAVGRRYAGGTGSPSDRHRCLPPLSSCLVGPEGFRYVLAPSPEPVPGPQRTLLSQVATTSPHLPGPSDAFQAWCVVTDVGGDRPRSCCLCSGAAVASHSKELTDRRPEDWYATNRAGVC